jgi:DNA-binding MarR family transcriptional regulator
MSNPNLFATDDSLGYLMGRGIRLLRALLDLRFRAVGHEVSMEQWVVLVHLWKQDGLHQQQLADIAGKDKTTMARALSVMEKRNWLLRVPDQLDKRHKRVFLTHEGKALEKELGKHVNEVLQEVTQGIDPAEMKICKQVLKQLHQNMHLQLNESNI